MDKKEPVSVASRGDFRRRLTVHYKLQLALNDEPEGRMKEKVRGSPAGKARVPEFGPGE
jgi:hypothetical protein